MPAVSSDRIPNRVTYTDTDGDTVTFVEHHGKLVKMVNQRFSRVVTGLFFSRTELSIRDQEGWGGKPPVGELHDLCDDLFKMAASCSVAVNLPQKPKVPSPLAPVSISFNVGGLVSCPRPELADRARSAVRVLGVDIPGVQWVEVESGGQVRFEGEADGCWSHLGKCSPHNEINLDPTWDRGQGPPLGTVLHELLHCLGMSHQHQRDDRDGFVLIDPAAEEENGVNYGIQADVHPYRYDSASIMHYPSGDLLHPGSQSWASIGQRRRLSQLDKAFMNMLYPPVAGCHGYQPRRGATGLWYCGRRVMDENNFPYGRVGCDGRCGPTNGPNCPSCIVYGVSQGDPYPLIRDGRMQGDTGLFYCGRRMQKADANHDGICGPHNGPCCPECFALLMEGSGGRGPLVVGPAEL